MQLGVHGNRCDQLLLCSAMLIGARLVLCFVQLSVKISGQSRRALQDTMYEIYPRIDEMKCNVHKISNSLSGISSSQNRKLLQVSPAPELGFVSLKLLTVND